MSLIYSGLYLTTNIIFPLSYMIYKELQCLAAPITKQDLIVQQAQKQQNQTTGNLQMKLKNQIQISTNSYYRCNYGQWTLLLLSMLLFNFLNSLISRSFTVILLGLIIKTVILKISSSLNHLIQQFIQKAHLEIYLTKFKSKAIDLYLDLSEKLNFFIIFYEIEQKDEKISILNRMKDSVSRIELDLEDNEEIKNRSFIVAVKKMQSINKKCKTYENVGINCDILKGSEVGKQLLKLLEEKTFSRQRSQGPHHSKIEQPTKDNFINQSQQIPKSAIYPSRSESLQQKIQKVKQTINVPTSQKKRINQVKVNQPNFIIKRSHTDIGEQFEPDQSPKRARQNLHITLNKDQTNTQKAISKKTNQISDINSKYYTERINQENASSEITNTQNVAILDIAQSQKSQYKKSYGSPDIGSLGKILEAQQLTKLGMNVGSNIQQPLSPRVIPPGLNISSIDQNTIHPFKVNLSSLSNPLIMSGNLTKSKILPNSIVTSNEYQIISSSKRQSSNSFIQPNMLQKHQFSNVSQVNTENMNVAEHFSQQSSIPNNVEVSINQSEYSDMFDSNSQDQEQKLEIKVEAVIQNQRQNGLKPRMDICYIQLYEKGEIKFMSVHDKLMYHGKLIKMFKKPQNFYDLVIQENKQRKSIQQGKNQIKQVIKKVKFRGQARPFMTYLQKIQS